MVNPAARIANDWKRASMTRVPSGPIASSSAFPMSRMRNDAQENELQRRECQSSPSRNEKINELEQYQHEEQIPGLSTREKIDVAPTRVIEKELKSVAIRAGDFRHGPAANGRVSEAPAYERGCTYMTSRKKMGKAVFPAAISTSRIMICR